MHCSIILSHRFLALSLSIRKCVYIFLISLDLRPGQIPKVNMMGGSLTKIHTGEKADFCHNLSAKYTTTTLSRTREQKSCKSNYVRFPPSSHLFFSWQTPERLVSIAPSSSAIDLLGFPFSESDLAAIPYILHPLFQFTSFK